MTRRTGIRRTSTVVAALALALVGCNAHKSKPAAVTTPTVPSSPTAPASGTPSTSPGPAAAIAWVGPIGFELPSSWSASDQGFGHACLQPNVKRPSYQGCSGLDVWYGWDSYLPGNETTTFSRDQPDGWYHETDVGACPKDPTGKVNGGENGIRTGGRPTVTGLRRLGARQAYYDKWSAHCDNGFTFTPQAWYLPVTKVVVFDYLGFADTAAVLKTAVYDTGRWLFGYIDGVTSSSAGNVVHIDEAQWLSGPAAQAYAHKHGQQEVPNDYIIVNDDTTTYAAPLLRTATITGNIEMANTEPDKPRPLTMLQFLAFERDKSHWGTTLHIHVDAEGRVDQIEEQFHP